MKKLLLLGVSLSALLGVGGCSYSAADYLQIGWNKVTESVKGSIPVGIEIDRLGLSLQQLDAEIASNTQKVVEESVALDRFAKLVDEKHQGLSTIKSDLSLLKNKYVSTTCDKTKGSLEKSMLTRVAASSRKLKRWLIWRRLWNTNATPLRKCGLRLKSRS